MRYDPDRHHRRSIRIGGYDYSQAGAYFVTVCTFERVLLFGNVVDGEMRLNETGRIVQQVWAGLADRFVAAHLDTFVVMPNHVHAVVMLTEGEGVMNHAPTGAGRGVGAQFIAPRTADTGAHPSCDEPLAAGVTNEGVMNHAPTGVGRGVEAQFIAPRTADTGAHPSCDESLAAGVTNEGVMNHAPTGVGRGVGAQFIAPRTADTGAHPSCDESLAAGMTNEGVMNHAPTIGEIVRALKAVSARRVRQLPNDSFAWQRNYYEHVVRNEAELNRIRQYIADNPGNWATDRQNPSMRPSSTTEKWQV